MFFFWLVLWLEVCVKLAVDKISCICFKHPPPPSLFVFFVPTHNSLSNTSDKYLKSVRASSWFRCHLAVYISLLVTLRKVSRRASCKALRWGKVNTIRRVCIVQYRIVFSFHLAKRINHLYPLRQNGTILFAFLRWPVSLWPRKQALGSQMN